MSRLEQLKVFLAADPKDSFTRYAIGLEYLSQKEYSVAITALEELLADDPAYIATYYQLAGAYRDHGMAEKAKATYLNGIQAARKAGDMHTAGELQIALDEMTEEE
jgi:Tfp pilus assembly protein PilF